ncbi:MAG TPA: sigma factor, partial [Candidatus Dormibacteraeota bacterium]
MQNVVVSAARPVELDFDSLVGPHLEAGYRTALAILRDPDEAHDAVQEAAFKAWRRLRQLRGEASGRAWFLAIVANQ